MDRELEALLNCTANVDVQREIEALMQRAGIYCRVFSRIKKADSLEKKLSIKKEKYASENKKLQDLIGVRIVLYFEDDREVCKKIISDKYDVDWENSEIDNLNADKFKAVRFNLICRMPESIASRFDSQLWESYPIDKSIEIQIRTIFSEGWHEVEHDIRYKHSDNWNKDENKEYSRFLNSIFATLEMCDSSIISLMDKMAYKAYKSCSVEEMFRYKYRIHFSVDSMSQPLAHILQNNKELLKAFFKLEREDVLSTISSSSLESFPKTMDNIVYICNSIWVHDEEISKLTPSFILGNLQSGKS